MSKSVHLDELAYRPDSCELFERINDLPNAAFLDSSYPHGYRGRYDIMTAAPFAAAPPLPPPGSEPREAEAFFDTLRAFHHEHFEGVQAASQDIPFSGGLLGFLGYDLGMDLQGVSGTHLTGGQIKAYHWSIVQDHLLKRAVLVTQPGVSIAERSDLLRRLCQESGSVRPTFQLQAPMLPDIDRAAYRLGFETIEAYIQAGDCYQANLAQHLQARYSGDPWQAYCALRKEAAAPLSAFLALDDDNALLSLSPERFLTLHGYHVETAPIKGTRPRYHNSEQDQLAIRELRNSTKERAENLMIVDLLRNDLGRNCVPGSIRVDRLFEVQTFPTVHHLVSTISGEMRPDRDAYDLLRDSFPGGSITGAPKKRAMEIIAEVETAPRGPYCGSVFYVSADGRMDSNIAIRTFYCNDGRIHCWAGGGIVADSQWQSEYQETFDKVGKLLAVLERFVTA